MPKLSVNLYAFTVEGKGYFPFPMLRNDQCWPRDEVTDVIEVSVGCGPASNDRLTNPRRVTLVGINEPNEQQWWSHGWRVLESKKLPT